MTTNSKRPVCWTLAALLHQNPANKQSITATIGQIIFLGLLVAGFDSTQTFAAASAEPFSDQACSAPKSKPIRLAAHQPKRANFNNELTSPEVRQVAHWVVDSKDNRGLPFVIVDKVAAKVFVFFPDGRLRGASPALLGLARGDDTVPGIGDRNISSIMPEERTTPAGRFVAALGYNLHGRDILWVDYDGAVSMHRVITNNPEERRLERLASPTPLDNRISYGCINVPVQFYDKVLRPTFTDTNGIVYVLPETRPVNDVFGLNDA